MSKSKSRRYRYLVQATRPDGKAGDGGEYMAISQADAIRQFHVHTGDRMVAWSVEATRVKRDPVVPPEQRPGRA